MPAIKRTTQRVVTTEVTEYRFSGDELRSLLLDAMKITEGSSRVFFSVPGGGDWSNMDIDITPEDPLVLLVERVTETEPIEGENYADLDS